MSNKLYDSVTNTIIGMLENADLGEFKKPWIDIGHSPISINGKAYRGINNLLLANSGHSSNVWGTYKGWQDKGCQVKRGEKARSVVFWKFFREGEADATTGEDKISAVYCRYYSVFNADQVEGEQAEAIAEKFKKRSLNSAEAFADCEQFISAYRNSQRLNVVPSDRAMYSHSAMTGTEYLQMPERRQFRDNQSYYSVYLHEMTHSTGHPKRLNRDLSGRFGSKDYAMEELIAELGAAYLCGDLGISNTPRADHAQYIKNWLSVLKKDNRAIFTAASRAQEAVDYIHQKVSYQLNPPELIAAE